MDPYESFTVLAPVAFACFSNSLGTIHAFDKTSQQAKTYNATSTQIKNTLKVFKFDICKILQHFATVANWCSESSSTEKWPSSREEKMDSTCLPTLRRLRPLGPGWRFEGIDRPALGASTCRRFHDFHGSLPLQTFWSKSNSFKFNVFLTSQFHSVSSASVYFSVSTPLSPLRSTQLGCRSAAQAGRPAHCGPSVQTNGTSPGNMNSHEQTAQLAANLSIRRSK